MRHEYEIVEHPHLEYLNLFLVKLIHRRLHLHREFEICMVLEGEVTVYTTGKTAVLKKEDVILLNPRQVHAFHSMTENALLLSIQVMPGAFEKICQGIRYTEFDTLCLSEPECQGETLDHLRELFYRLGIAYYEKQPNYEFFCMAYIYEIFGQIFRIYPWHILTERQKMNVYQQGKRMERILEYVDRNYTDKLLLTEIAEQEKLSVAYLSHFFKDTMGMTFQQYVNFLRFEKARKMIENTTVSISEISILCGFSDYRYLNKIYKEQLGYLPSEYRSTHCAPKIREDSEDLENDQTFVLSGKALEFLKKAAEKNQKKR